MIAFLLKYWQAAGLVALLAFGVTEWELHNHALIAQGKAEERARVADSIVAAIKPQMAHTDTLLIRDTVTLTKLVPALRTLRDTLLLHLTDTVQVKVYIEKADSTVKACTDLLSSCTIFRREAQATIAALETKVAAIPAAQPRSCFAGNALFSILGVGVGFLGAKVAH